MNYAGQAFGRLGSGQPAGRVSAAFVLVGHLGHQVDRPPLLVRLGVVGGEIHSEREWMRVSSLAERGKLSALLVLRLASGELTWP